MSFVHAPPPYIDDAYNNSAGPALAKARNGDVWVVGPGSPVISPANCA